MKTLDRCSLRVGQELVIRESERGDDLHRGDRLRVVGFQMLSETVSQNFRIGSSFYWEGEAVFTRLYVAELNGGMYLVWPEETTNGHFDVQYLR
ncbi:hypothetical protein AB1A81_06405 [Bdellovibrio bacteriovorus]|uniref:Uncharacterized protein n=1 Tax=Bdellovibrio bacteriovorus (strain ATCC 15356 / DSM 50701 / NCIMB 9529 / HD100) TaxID=264462 RepID=Q6MN55_BDEBA|nr:hypothetical protein [Bdellovibrio bacteriovorus]AHZ86608.1 hypothetical protein EP01_16950 [Bdellovibrio bacteriovorus]BEV67855.1 hypothetical protein Bb109J_c1275 [Bdellovibrio bacteriovorus]CAE79297.1 hypothetical protein predicted by Glimmer/Critica [Bdellovibrio bacteriovorus HD100]